MAAHRCLLAIVVLVAVTLSPALARPSVECSCEGCLYPSLDDCATYWKCEGGRAVEQQCGAGLLFNRDTSRCELAVKVECTKSVRLQGDFAAETCVDKRVECPVFAAAGGCECRGDNCDWPAYVVSSCAKSCDMCGAQSKFWPWWVGSSEEDDHKPWWKDSSEEGGWKPWWKDSSEESGSSESGESGEGGSSESGESGEGGSSESGEGGSSESGESGEGGENGSGEETEAPETQPPPPPTAAPTTRPPPPPTAAPTTRPPPPPTAAPTTKPPPPPTAAPTTRPPPPPTAAPTTKPPPPPTAAPTTKPPPPPTAAPTTKPPPPPTPAPTPKPGYCGIDCSAGQYHPHPFDCHMFIQCTPSGPQEMPCAPGTVWDQELLTCNHEASTPCVIPLPCIESQDKQCREVEGRISLEGNKNQYLLCHSGVSLLLHCPNEGTFNPKTESCVYKDHAIIA